MFRKILVAIDTSETSKQAFAQAVFLAKATAAHLMLVNVWSPAGLNTGYPNLVFPSAENAYIGLQTEAFQDYMQQWEVLQKEGLELLQSCAEEATALGIPTEYTQPLGDPGKEICEVARNWGANLIIIGRRGRTGLSELILGSVSNYVTHHAHCSVLTVQGEAEAPAETI